MVESEKNTKIRMIASIFLFAVLCVCVESIMGLSNIAVKALGLAVALVSVFLLLSLLAGMIMEKTNKKKEESD